MVMSEKACSRCARFSHRGLYDGMGSLQRRSIYGVWKGSQYLPGMYWIGVSA